MLFRYSFLPNPSCTCQTPTTLRPHSSPPAFRLVHLDIFRCAFCCCCRGALDIFSQFFVSPLFTESSTGRELLAVDSEDSKNRTNDSRRVLQVEEGRGGVDHSLLALESHDCCRLGICPFRDGAPFVLLTESPTFWALSTFRSGGGGGVRRILLFFNFFQVLFLVVFR